MIKVDNHEIETIKIGTDVLETVPIGTNYLVFSADETEEETEAESEQEPVKKTRRQLRRERKLAKRRASYEKALTKDMRYRGPLSYRYLRAFAWIIIIVSQVTLFYKIGVYFSPKLEGTYNDLKSFVYDTSDLILPLFLVANFAYILDKKQSYKTMLVKYALLSAAIYIGIFLVYNHFILGLQTAMEKGGWIDKGDIVNLISKEGVKGGLCFNIFTDLFLCTLFMFFLNYEPRRFFRGKKIYIFRMFAILPIAYEVLCICLKILAFEEKITIPIMMFPLMTTKPPMMIAFFVFMAFYIRRKEKNFLATGLSREQYKVYEKTNTNSWHFSLHACRMCIRCAILDVIALVLVLVLLLINVSIQRGIELDVAVDIVKDAPMRWGFGSTVNLVGMIPVFLLFSYSKSHKNNKVDAAMPLAAVIIIIYVYIEGFYRILSLLAKNGANTADSLIGLGL